MKNLIHTAIGTVIIFSTVYTLMIAVGAGSTAKATSNPLTQLITPSGTLTLTANTPTNLPRPAGWAGKTCTVVLWNPSTKPIYFGGITLGDGGVTTGTVNIAGGMPICADSTQCIVGPVSLDASSVAVVSAVNILAGDNVRYVFGGGC